VIGPQWARVLACGLGLMLCGAAAAQDEAPQQAFTPPRVVAAVYSAGGPVDRVLLLFDREVPRDSVAQRIARLAELCDSKVWDLETSYGPFVSLMDSDDDDAESEGVTQTTVRFGMAGLTDWKRGTLAVEPFAQAFREDLPVRIKYHIGAEFPFREPAESAFLVDGVLIRHYPFPTSHVYDVTSAPPDAVTAPIPEAPAPVSARGWTAVMIVLAIAIILTLMTLIGLIAYGVRTQSLQGAGRPIRLDMEQVRQQHADPDSSESPGESDTERG